MGGVCAHSVCKITLFRTWVQNLGGAVGCLMGEQRSTADQNWSLLVAFLLSLRDDMFQSPLARAILL